MLAEQRLTCATKLTRLVRAWQRDRCFFLSAGLDGPRRARRTPVQGAARRRWPANSTPGRRRGPNGRRVGRQAGLVGGPDSQGHPVARRSAALQHAAQPLPSADGLDRRRHERKLEDAGEMVRRDRAPRQSDGRRGVPRSAVGRSQHAAGHRRTAQGRRPWSWPAASACSASPTCR